MKKVAAVFDGLRLSDSTLQYAIAVAKQQPSHLVGLFLDDFTYNSFSMYNLLKAGATRDEINVFEAKDKKTRDISVKRFEAACQEAGLNYSVHRDRSIAIQEVLHESIYADLLVVDMDETLVRSDGEPPTRFIRDLLTDVQCPVLVVPPDYQEIKKVALLYDGEPSSVYAIKMFSYLMPCLQHLEAEVVSVNQEGSGIHMEDGRLMKEFMKRHFPKAHYQVSQGQPEEEILGRLQQQPEGTLAVLGAYRRGTVSRWFRASMADVLMRKLRIPLFIAHNK
jgi:nucleotide-binding universal stress UspA family protein